MTDSSLVQHSQAPVLRKPRQLPVHAMPAHGVRSMFASHQSAPPISSHITAQYRDENPAARRKTDSPKSLSSAAVKPPLSRCDCQRLVGRFDEQTTRRVHDSARRGAEAGNPRIRRARTSGCLSNRDTVVHLLSGHHKMSKEETGLDVVPLQERAVFKQALYTHSCRKIRKNMLHGNPYVSDNRLSAKNLGAHCNSFEQIIFMGHDFLLQSIRSQPDQLGAARSMALMSRFSLLACRYRTDSAFDNRRKSVSPFLVINHRPLQRIRAIPCA